MQQIGMLSTLTSLKGIGDELVTTFPEKLMIALKSDVATDTIQWLHDGKAFVIINKCAFMTK
eukprot:13231902-Ditylum_brightwellii.AAC.1